MSETTTECARCGGRLPEMQPLDDMPVCIACDRDILAGAYRDHVAQLSESARTIDAQAGRIHGLTTQKRLVDDEVAQLYAQLGATSTERDEARSRLAKAREEIEGLAAQLAAALKDLHATTPGEVIEARVVRKIADWLERTTEPNDPCDGHCIAAAIRANAWRSK